MRLWLALAILAHLVALVFAAGGSATQCTGSKAINLPSFTGKVLSLSFPRTSDVVVQAIPGASWAATIYSDDTRLPDLVGTATVSGNTLTINVADSAAPVATTPPPAGASSLSPLHPMVLVALICGLISLFGFSSGRLSPLACAILLSIPLALAVPPARYYCSRGTLVITYPAGGEIFINGLRYSTCSSVGGATAPQVAIPYPNVTGTWPPKNAGVAWFSSPFVGDLDMDPTCTSGCNEIVHCAESCRVYDDTLRLIQSNLSTNGRVYSSHCVADFDGNGFMDLCAAGARRISCWEWNGNIFVARSGWPRDISGSSYPLISNGEIRGMGCADVDFDGIVDIVVSTTNSRIQHYMFDAFGNMKPGWPRYNTATGPLNDADPDNDVFDGINKFGHYRYGSYGLNVGIGNMDDDADLEIIGTYDNHQIQAFKKDGVGINMASFYTQIRRSNNARDSPVTWGQATPRWTNITTDNYQWHSHADGDCYANPVDSPCVPGGDEWLQFTQSPASVMDIDGDGMAEVISIPNSEKGSCCNGGGYYTTGRALFVLDGAYGNNGNPQNDSPRSGLRKVGFDSTFPQMGGLIACASCFDSTGSCNSQSVSGQCRVDQYYPPQSVPSPAFADLTGSGTLATVFSFGDGTVTAFSATNVKLWTFNFAADAAINIQNEAFEASEPTIADLNGDGNPEVIFTTFGRPTEQDNVGMSTRNNQWLYCLNGQSGTKIWSVRLNSVAAGVAAGDLGNGNGNGAAGAPTIADLDGDGELEIVFGTFDGRLLVYTVPGSSTNCLVWPTGRGGFLRKGQPDVGYAA